MMASAVRSVPSWNVGSPESWKSSRAFAVFGFLSARIRRSSSMRSPSSGCPSRLTKQWNTSPSLALKVSSSSFEPHVETSAAGCRAAPIRRRA